MKSLPIDRPTLDDPLYSQKNPYQVFLLSFGLIMSIPVLLGGHSGSRALDTQLSPSTVFAWSCCLLIGSAIGLVGEFWRGHTWVGLSIERAGLALVGFGGFIYAWVLLHTERVDDVRYVAAVTAAYAFACLWRVGQITRRLLWLRIIIAEVNAKASR